MTAERRVRTAARAIIVEQDALLVVEYEDALGPWFLLPGGGQLHEEPLDDCLVREAREELGVTIRVGALLHVREFVSSQHPDSHLGSGFHQVEVIFQASIVGEETPHMPATADRLQRGVRWLPLSELASHRLHPLALRDALAAGTRGTLPGYLGAIL